ncbi:hypothetical protein C8Q75DRAFT_740341 [Abortiporus biennis]|nr:hypothetical protein C8Q75DRAFT_740341 [Abortiporus biennis]
MSLIPPPDRPALACSSGASGPNLCEQLDMEKHKFRELCYQWRVVATNCLDVTKTIDDQDIEQWRTFVEKAKHATPILSLYESSWPVESYMRLYLGQLSTPSSLEMHAKRLRKKKIYRPVRHERIYIRNSLLARTKNDSAEHVVGRIIAHKSPVVPGHCFVGRRPARSKSRTPAPSPPPFGLPTCPEVSPPAPIPEISVHSPIPLPRPESLPLSVPILSRPSSPVLPQTGSSSLHFPLPRGHIASVEAFLESLEKPQPKLLTLFKSMGIVTLEDLYGFALLPSREIWLKDLVNQKDINILQMMFLCEGLQKLARSLPDRHCRNTNVNSVETFLGSLCPDLSKLIPVFDGWGIADISSLRALAISKDRDCYLAKFMKTSGMTISELERRALSEGLDIVGRRFEFS